MAQRTCDIDDQEPSSLFLSSKRSKVKTPSRRRSGAQRQQTSSHTPTPALTQQSQVQQGNNTQNISNGSSLHPPIFRLTEDRRPTFRCPLTGYPNVIWLKGAHKQLIRPHFNALVQDDTTQLFVFNNRPEVIEQESRTGKPLVSHLLGRDSKPLKLAWVLRDEMKVVCEIVVTNVGGEEVSETLLAFHTFVRQSIEGGSRAT